MYAIPLVVGLRMSPNLNRKNLRLTPRHLTIDTCRQQPNHQVNITMEWLVCMGRKRRFISINSVFILTLRRFKPGTHRIILLRAGKTQVSASRIGNRQNILKQYHQAAVQRRFSSKLARCPHTRDPGPVCPPIEEDDRLQQISRRLCVVLKLLWVWNKI